jgi:hypothetical protein
LLERQGREARQRGKAERQGREARQRGKAERRGREARQRGKAERRKAERGKAEKGKAERSKAESKAFLALRNVMRTLQHTGVGAIATKKEGKAREDRHSDGEAKVIVGAQVVESKSKGAQVDHVRGGKAEGKEKCWWRWWNTGRCEERMHGFEEMKKWRRCRIRKRRGSGREEAKRVRERRG